jgi:hypothetical protein
MRYPKSNILVDREIAFVEVYCIYKDDVWSIIDSEDAEKIKGIRWDFWNGYVRNRTSGYMHRIILEARTSSLVTDHINHDTTNNRKKNLRLCTCSINAFNRGPPKNNKSGFKGVHWNSQKKRWRALIEINGKDKHLGFFKDIEKAKEARLLAEEKLGVRD